jgi:phosphate acetyltransferase
LDDGIGDTLVYASEPCRINRARNSAAWRTCKNWHIELLQVTNRNHSNPGLRINLNIEFETECVGRSRGDHKVEPLMKGSLHTDEFMSAVVGEEKLRTARRMSHVFIVDAPRYSRPLFVTDAALNIYPTLEEKADIVQNAICLAHTLGLERPKVAILSAVETVSPKIKSTLDAAVLCKMADRGQITGGILDGPLAFDNAVSEEAANAKNIVSPVAGRADILLVPDLDSGNMLAKQLEYLAGAQIAGIVLGARVPIVLTSRADKAPARLVSCAIARLLARNNARSERLGA